MTKICLIIIYCTILTGCSSFQLEVKIADETVDRLMDKLSPIMETSVDKITVAAKEAIDETSDKVIFAVQPILDDIHDLKESIYKPGQYDGAGSVGATIGSAIAIIASIFVGRKKSYVVSKSS